MTRIIEVPDGCLDYPREALLSADVPADVASRYPPAFPVPYRPLLIQSGGTTVLLDTGAGPLGPSTGQLHDRLRDAGIALDTVDLVLLSHGHADHIGGLLTADGLPAFPNARIVMARAEFDFWRTSRIREKLGTGDVYGNAAIETVIRDWFERYLLPLKPKLELVDVDSEVLPGIWLLAAPGHTPGHSAVLVETEDEPSVLFTADAFALPEHIAHPEWTSSFDLDRELTIRTRRRLLDLAAAESYRVIHYHIGCPGFVIRSGHGFEWHAEQNVTIPRNLDDEQCEIETRERYERSSR
jgi:glyoxylase-like metal-dependent hydrolase (beta-lactamase superfamily II)